MTGSDADATRVLHMSSTQYPESLDLIDQFRVEDAGRHDGTMRPRAIAASMLIKAGYLAYQERFHEFDGQSGR